MRRSPECVRLAVTGGVPNLQVTKLEGDISGTPRTVATGQRDVLVGNKANAKVRLC